MDALHEMETALLDDLAPRDRMQILNNTIIIRAALGDDVTAQMAELEKSSADMSGPLWRAFMADPAANQALALGDFARARDQFKLLFDADASQIPEYSYRAAHAAIWARDIDGAHELAAISDATGGRNGIVEARRDTLRAGIAALEGRPAEALPLYRDALRNWRSAGAVWDEVLTGISDGAAARPRRSAGGRDHCVDTRHPRAPARQAVPGAPRRSCCLAVAGGQVGANRCRGDRQAEPFDRGR